MHTRHVRRQSHQRVAQPATKNTAVLVVPQQSGDAIRRRREIREEFHDSKALTITADGRPAATRDASKS